MYYCPNLIDSIDIETNNNGNCKQFSEMPYKRKYYLHCHLRNLSARPSSIAYHFCVLHIELMRKINNFPPYYNSKFKLLLNF